MFAIHTYITQPLIQTEYDRIYGLETEDQPLSRMIEQITRTYKRPCLVTWYTMKGIVEYHYVTKRIAE